MQIFCFMLKKHLSLIIFFSSISIHINAQELDYFDYEREILWGINKNTNGGLIGGGVLKFSNKIAEKLYSTIGVELVNVKHSKENKYSSALGYGRTFIWAKQNYFFSFRGQYGREMILFSKKDQQGIQVNAQVAIGPSIGMQIPYYIKYNRNSRMEIEPFDPDIHNFNNVIGVASFTEGFKEMKIRPGINFKTAINFEFGSKKSSTAIEVGFLAEAFTKKIIIMPTAENKSIFTSAFITLFYGRKY